MRVRVPFPLLFVIASLIGVAVGQSPNGTVSGLVLDPSGRAIPGAGVLIVSDVTGVKYPGATNGEGIYAVPNLPPGTYRIQVSKRGFKTLIKPDVMLNVQTAAAINFTLPLGAVSEVVTVEGGAPLINTESATVSTVIDRQFAENMPLNGRSFQTLIMLTPGVALTPASYGSQGQFSVNGQRADANYFSVDGVSANTGIAAANGLTQSASGSLPATSALGGTNSLVAVDAMQEFRIQTSSFAPEFGRSPGAQVSIVTRSGTNQFHGTLFDYFRNDVLDANDWFASRAGLPKPKERQNDFGGVFGGPLVKDRTFLFFSYEGLRLRQPKVQTTIVPSAASRQMAPAVVQPFLTAFPFPNGADLGNGLAEFAASYADPASLDSYSLRLDHVFSPKWTVFGRYSYALSRSAVLGGGGVLSDDGITAFTSHSLTLGLTTSASLKTGNEVRVNYSNVRGSRSDKFVAIAGAIPIPDSLMFAPGFSASNANFGLAILGAGNSSLGFGELVIGKTAVNEQRQINLVDNVSLTVGSHQIKFGVDYRRLSPISGLPPYQGFLLFSGVDGPDGSALSGTALLAETKAFQEASLVAKNFSLYAQDTWRANPRCTLTYGIRWDINPAPTGANSKSAPLTVQGLDNPSALTLAPPGTPLYETTFDNVAPRLGLAYQLRQKQGWESVLRGGVGAFYDLGSGALGNLTFGFPFSATSDNFFVPLPLTPQQLAPPVLSRSLPQTGQFDVADPHLKLPRTYQWNLAMEQSLGSHQTVSVTYVAAAGRKLLRGDTVLNPNPNFQTVYVTRNTATSDYQALQVKFQRNLSQGLQALASYTWSHSIDIVSNDATASNTPTTVDNPAIDRGNSDFDVRHSFTGALLYNVPSPMRSKFARSVLGDWAIEGFSSARAATPVDIIATTSFVPGAEFTARPEVQLGVPFYLYGSQYPGGKAINPASLSAPPSGQQGNLGRNELRGFGAWQIDFAMHRQFHLTEAFGLQFRAELFNIFNHPNFGNPVNVLTSPLFGVSTQMLATSLGSGGTGGGLNPLYQIGGPRSIQLALKLQF
jgi:hypothetical protein